MTQNGSTLNSGDLDWNHLRSNYIDLNLES